MTEGCNQLENLRINCLIPFPHRKDNSHCILIDYMATRTASFSLSTVFKNIVACQGEGFEAGQSLVTSI